MAFYRTMIRVAAAAAVLFLATSSKAQQHQPFGPVDFESDAQMFQTLNLDNLGEFDGQWKGYTGYFASYDRTYLFVSRAQNQGNVPNRNNVNPWEGDPTLGHRFDLGYMSQDKPQGWLISGLIINGPDLRPENTWVDPNPAVAPDPPNNNPNPISNLAELNSIEVSKIWRHKPFHNGAIIEPMMGLRYIGFNDNGYTLVDSVFVANPQLKRENDMILGQVGCRLYKRTERWTISGEARGFAGNNYQFSINNLNEEFVVGGEARVTAAYQITRDFSLQVGWELLYIGCGVARVNGNGDEDLSATGVVFGFNMSR
jgi:hypothetical protein